MKNYVDDRKVQTLEEAARLLTKFVMNYKGFIKYTIWNDSGSSIKRIGNFDSQGNWNLSSIMSYKHNSKGSIKRK